MTAFRSVLLLGSALALSACQPAEAPVAETAPPPAAPVETPAPPAEPAAELQAAASARSSLQPVADSGVGGELRFTVENGAVRVTGTLTGLKPGGTHAFHIHEFGNCTAADASSAGGHFNPAAAAHGNREGEGEHHAGDIPNQTADRDGNANVDQLLEGLEIGSDGELDILGRGVIVHADADDYTTQPTGNAGGRLACGVIEAEIGGSAQSEPAR
jgi:Cu-Zn family superoxide dismutase